MLDLPNTLSIVASVIAIITFLWGVYKAIKSLLSYFSIPDSIAGIYVSSFQQAIYGKSKHDILLLKKTIFGITGFTIYTHTEGFEYKLRANKLKNSNDVYEGTWYNTKNRNFLGPFQLKLSESKGQLSFSGAWIGPNAYEYVKYGEWNIVKSKLRSDPRSSKTKKKSNNLLDTMVHKHEEFKSKDVLIDNLYLKLLPGVFNPFLGKISQSLVTSIRRLELRFESVLDLGCGCGYYAIYFAKEYRAKVWATDVDEESIKCTQANASTNDVTITTIKSFGKRLYSNIDDTLKFDLIVANLPFSSKDACQSIRKSKYYHCFAYEPGLYLDLIIGASCHLNEGGSLIFTYGQSGYNDSLDDLFMLAGMSYTIIETRVEKDETFYIYKGNKDLTHIRPPDVKRQ